jgi:hypothetical protein
MRGVTASGPGHQLHQAPHGAPSNVMTGGTEHTHHVVHTMTGGTTMPAGHDLGGMSPAGMLAAHLLAALLCGLWMAYGEQAAFSLLRTFAGWLVAPLRLLLPLPTPPDRPRVRARRDHGAHPLRQLLLGHTITSRGPPSGVAVI